MTAALLVVAGYTFLIMRDENPGGLKRAWRPFLLGGVAASCGIFFYANALQGGEVYRVLPLIRTSPLFTVLFAFLLLLRRAEDITWRVPVGAVLTGGGALLVTLPRGIA